MPLNVLKKYFGYDQFRDGQQKLVGEILQGNDVLGIMPTGAGKSICFQVPAMMMDGITLVVSPLISLMQDQVKGLIQSGVKAAFINSSLSPRQVDTALYNAKMGKYKIIYVAPERLLTDNFLSFATSVNISMLTVDEAHCISQWGQDFRPSYAQIPEFIGNLQTRPVVSAFTATATEKVKEDIVDILKLNNPLVLVSGFDRANLYFEVQNSNDKLGDLLDFLKDKKDKSGIVYCSTRKNVESVCDELQNRDYCAQRYHAGLSQDERKQNQNDFIYDKVKIIVATNAFGMGIDKPNVNFVVHYNMPKDMESYYQEAGRAGRDGMPAHCLMLYSGQDVATNQFLIENNSDATYESPEIEKFLKEQAYKRLKDITFYSTTNDCLRKFILRYFGENPPMLCENCSNCDTKFEVIDATIESQKIISCVKRTDERFGKGMIIDVLRGSKNQKVLDWGFDKLSTYGISELSATRLRLIIDNLIVQNYLMQTNDQYNIVKTTAKSLEILKGFVKFEAKIATEKIAVSSSKNKDQGIPKGREDLFEKLRELRAKIAKEQSVPAFVVFGDASLVDMCYKLPKDEKEFLSVSGVGYSKQEKYGAEFTSLIADYCTSASIDESMKSEVRKRKSAKKSDGIVLPSQEMIDEIEVLDEEVSVSVVNNYINDMLEYYDCTKTTSVKISDWLVSKGYLEQVLTDTGTTKVPTKKGFDSGIISQEKSGRDYSYKINLYPKSMQEFIVENIVEVLKFVKDA